MKTKLNIELISDYRNIAIIPIANPKTQKYDGEWWQLLTSLSIKINGRTINIPAGFISDLGSVPRIARSIVSKEGVSLLGYLFHDWLYCKHEEDISGTSWMNRQECDEALYTIGKMCGQTEFKSITIYEAVRVGGWVGYAKHPPIVVPVESWIIDNINRSYFNMLSMIELGDKRYTEYRATV